MRWTTEQDRTGPRHVLALEPDEQLAPAFVELWKRILCDGLAASAEVDWRSLSLDIEHREVTGDSQGSLHAVFRDGGRRHCQSVGHYYVRGDAFDLYQGGGEDNKAFNKRQIHWLLQHYGALKQAAASAEVVAAWQCIAQIRPLYVDAATAFGWFDLQIGEDSFGPLPGEDQDMLAGLDPRPGDTLAHLTAGLPMELIGELNAALIAYTPAHFAVICCEITLGSEGGRPALFYRIECPQYPDEGTTSPNDRVHAAASEVVRAMTTRGRDFPGVAIRLELKKDGEWRANLRLLTAEAA
jgi:hypothetical protein